MDQVDLLLQRPFRMLVVLAMAWSTGTHWAVLQTGAWVRMTWDQSQETTLADAVGRVLGGVRGTMSGTGEWRVRRSFG